MSIKNIDLNEQMGDLDAIEQYMSIVDECCRTVSDAVWNSLFRLTLPALLFVQHSNSDSIEIQIVDCENADPLTVEWASEAGLFEIAVAVGHIDDGDFAPDWMGFVERNLPERVN